MHLFTIVANANKLQKKKEMMCSPEQWQIFTQKTQKKAYNFESDGTHI